MSVAQPIETTVTSTEPVLAEIVPPAPSPWRFGLKALLGLMAVCSVQFAAMNYLGVLQGLAVGFAACAAVFAITLFVGLIMGKSGPRVLAHLDALVVRLMLAMVVLFLGTILAGGGTAAWRVYSHLSRERTVEKNLGLGLARVQVVHDNRVVTALQITSLEDGGAAHQAGLQRDEIILVDGTIDELLTMLEANRGKDVDVSVATGALSTPVERCPKRSVTLTVPK